MPLKKVAPEAEAFCFEGAVIRDFGNHEPQDERQARPQDVLAYPRPTVFSAIAVGIAVASIIIGQHVQSPPQ